MLNLIVLILNLLQAVTFCNAQNYVTSSNVALLQLWNKNTSVNLIDNGKNQFSGLEYDAERGYIFAGADTLIVWDIKNNKQVISHVEKGAVYCIAKVNSTLVLLGYDYYLVFLKGDNITREELRVTLGKVRSLKVLEQENKVLVGSLDKQSIFLFCLIKRVELSNIDLRNAILALDSIGRDFIVSQCYTSFVCVHNLTVKDTFVEVKRSLNIGTKNDIFAIKIINERSVFLGCTLYLGFWNVTDNNVIQLRKTAGVNYQVSIFDLLDNERIGAINAQGNLDVWSISSLSYLETLKNDNNLVYAFKVITPMVQLNSNNISLVINQTNTPTITTSTKIWTSPTHLTTTSSTISKIEFSTYHNTTSTTFLVNNSTIIRVTQFNASNIISSVPTSANLLATSDLINTHTTKIQIIKSDLN